MRIHILGLNYAPELVGIGPYTAGLAEALVEAGHSVTVVCAKPYYPAWKVERQYAGWRTVRSVENGVTVLRCPLYVPRHPGGLLRVLHHLSFAITSFIPMVAIARRERPDLILTIAPSLLSAPVARLSARLAGARSWLHLQDFEIEAAFATGLLQRDSFVGLLARMFQRWGMSGFDRYSTISPQMCARLEAFDFAVSKVVELRNWAEIDLVRVLDRPSPFRDEWRIGDRQVVLYSGNIALKQGIGILIDAARRLVARDDICLVICGNGPKRAELQAEAADLPNVMLCDLQPVERLSDLLGLASVHVLPQLAGAADLVLPSKLTNMLASGRPIIATAGPGTGLAAEVEGCGLVTPPGDGGALANAIEHLIDNPDLASALGRVARVRATERWLKETILTRLVGQVKVLHDRGK